MRHADLREATKKAAEKSKHKLETRLTRGEKRYRKRMAQVATVYTIEPWVRTPMDIMHDLRRSRAVATRRPRPVNKRVWASLEADPKKVIDEAFEEGLRRDPERRRRWVVLVDGNRDQLRLVKQAAKKKPGVECDDHPRPDPRARILLEGRALLPQGRHPGVGAVGEPAAAGAATGTCGGRLRQGPPSLGARGAGSTRRSGRSSPPASATWSTTASCSTTTAPWPRGAACNRRDRGRVPVPAAGSPGHHGRALVAARRRSCAQAPRPAFQRRLRGVLGLPPRARAARNHEVRYANGQVPGPLWPTKPTWGR